MSTTNKNVEQIAQDTLQSIENTAKAAKVFPHKCRRLSERLQGIQNHLKNLSSNQLGVLLDRQIFPTIVFLLKEISSFLQRFTETQYLLKSWSNNIDLERFHDLTEKIFEMEVVLELQSSTAKRDSQAIALEDAQDKKEDHLHHKKVLEGLKPDNANDVQSGLEEQETKIVEPLPSSSDTGREQLLAKLEQIESESEVEIQNADARDLTALECERIHVNKIGEGKFGVVYKGQIHDEEVAVKYLREAAFSTDKHQMIQKEIAKLQVLKHDNIVRFFGAQTAQTPLFFVFERMFCSLYSALYAHDENQKLGLAKTNYTRKLELLIDCARGIEFLHSVNLLHRNIKSTNILITSSGTAKIGDFSFAMNKQDLNSSLMGGASGRASITGTGALLSAQKVFPAYLAPEIILHPNNDPVEYNFYTDTYAFGILVNEVLTHTPPFPGLTFRNIMSKLQKSENNRPQLFAQKYHGTKEGNALVFELKSLIERAWATTATERPSFTHILLILERIHQLSFTLTDAVVSESGGAGKSSISSFEENAASGGGIAFNTRKSFYEKAPVDVNNNESLFDLSNDTNDLSMSRDAGDSSPMRTNKIATIIETYEKGFGSGGVDRSYDRSFDRSMDHGDSNVFLKIYDKFERSMDKSHDMGDKSRSLDKSKSLSSEQQQRQSLRGVFDPTVEVDHVPSADRSDIVSVNAATSEGNKDDSKDNSNPLDLRAIGIAVDQSASLDSGNKVETAASLSRSADTHEMIAPSRTLDSYDSHAPNAFVTATSESSQPALKTSTSLEFIPEVSENAEPVDDPEYNHSKYIAQLFYDAGSCGKKDSQQKLEELAASEDLLALGFLMGMLCYGSGMPKDVKKANEIARKIYPSILQRADDENDASRKFYQYIAGLCYEQGVGVEKNDILAVKYYQWSADQGYAAALSNLGYCYKHGQGVKEDRYEAVRLYGLGADQNHATSLNNLGYCYQHGYGVEKDLQEAVRLYQRSAEQGHSTAQNNLGYCYQYGQGCEKNLAEAVRLYELSANQGCSFGQNSLGHCYKRGHGVPKDYIKAVYYYRLSAEQGHATAQNNLGYCYQYGQGVDVNYGEAVRWYKLSVEQGQASAENNLGFCYQCGIGVKKDLGEAVRLYKSSAEKGYAVAMYNLGLCYLNGMGVANNAEKAVQLIKSSAEQGHTAGQVKLAMCFEEGVGVAKDTREAIRWYVMAARRGDETAMKALKRIHG